MRFSYVLILGIVAAFVFGVYAFLTPVNLKEDVKIELPYNTSVSKSAKILHDAGVIRTSESYIILSKLLYPKGIVAGKYTFSGNTTVFSVIERVSNGRFGKNQVKLTIPEGFTIKEITARIKSLFPNAEESAIKAALENKEGYIYPETYFFDKDALGEEITKDLINRSNLMLSKILSPIELSSSEAKRILTIASLLESEGRTKEERHIISGIIENRLKLGMPLQLDATLTYITGKESSELTLNDLKIDSKYNTYVYKGLPPAPISSAGEESIKAAMNPTPSDYLYYLHAADGSIYYAKTFDEHVKNKQKYLR